MPKAPVNENHFSAAGEHQVRLAREIFAMEPESIAQSVRKLAYRHLGLHPLARDAPHVFRAAFGCQLVHSLEITPAEDISSHS